MARPTKQGLDYFSHDTDMSSDPKVEYIEALYGLVGYAVINKLLEKIYRNGYYLVWEERDFFVFSKHINIEVNVCRNLINECIKENIFSSKLYKNYNILSSHGIQIRYIKACERRTKIDLINEFLVNETKTYINDNIKKINVNINSINSYKSTQSKVKESKVNTPPISPPRGNKFFNKFWEVYPLKASKGRAEKAFKKIKPDERLLALMVAKIEQARKSERWLKNNGEFIPYPASWLNAKGWEDEIEMVGVKKEKTENRRQQQQEAIAKYQKTMSSEELAEMKEKIYRKKVLYIIPDFETAYSEEEKKAKLEKYYDDYLPVMIWGKINGKQASGVPL